MKITKDSHTVFSNLKQFPLTPRMPILFIGHGSPMNAIENNSFTAQWQKIGKNISKPHAIIVMSAHWVTLRHNYISAIENPPMIYDMFGFPDELYAVKYSAPGKPELATTINSAIPKIQLDNEWGLDHGAWSILMHLYPNADIPILQLSINFSLSPIQEFELLQQLQELRNHGILFIGSGNIVHNLRAINWDNKTYDWALEFDQISSSLIEKRDTKSLTNYQNLGSSAQLSIPTDEHYRPMLATLAMSHKEDSLKFFNEEIIMGSVGMRSFILE